MRGRRLGYRRTRLERMPCRGSSPSSLSFRLSVATEDASLLPTLTSRLAAKLIPIFDRSSNPGYAPFTRFSIVVRSLLLQKPLGILNQTLSGREHLAGDSFTVADLNVASILASPHPSVARSLERALERPAYNRMSVC